MLGRSPGTGWPKRSQTHSQQSFLFTSELSKKMIAPESETCSSVSEVRSDADDDANDNWDDVRSDLLDLL